MKTKPVILFVLLTLMHSLLFGQAEYVIEIDRTTGNFTKTGPGIPGVGWVYPNQRAYDEANGRYIFCGGATMPDHLYSINVADGSVAAHPSFPISRGQQYEFDNSTGTLYGLFFDQSGYSLETINPTTGAISTLPPFLPNLPMCAGFTTFDEINHKYLLCVGDAILAVDASTGVVSSNQLMALQPGDVLVCASLAFNNSSGMLYGLIWDQAVTGKYFLAAINPASGAITKTGAGNTFKPDGSACIDKVNNRYMYLYPNTTANAWQIATVDIATGNPLYDNVVQVFTASNNFYGIEYDNTRNKLVCKHWESNSPSLCNTGTVSITADKNTICANDTARICAPAGHASYLWNTGATTSCIYTLQGGNYYVTVTDGTGCSAVSNHLAISVLPQPPVSISVSGNTLTAYNASSYQWYLDGNEIPGATSATYVITEEGVYTVAVTGSNGCKAVSTGINITGVQHDAAELPITIHPNPFDANLTVDLYDENADMNIYDSRGRTVYTQKAASGHVTINCSEFSAGMYILVAKTNARFVVKKVVKK